MSVVLLTAEQIRAEVSMRAAIDAVANAFRGLVAGEFELPVRTALGEGRFLSMASHHRPTGSGSVKSVLVDFARRPAVSGAMTFAGDGLADTLVLDAATVTSLRTGAVVGLATDLLAPVDARSLVLIGLGGQAPDQLRAVRAVRDLERVCLVEQEPARIEEFVRRQAEDLAGLEVSSSTVAGSVLGDADIVCCATPATTPLFAAGDLPARVHVNAIGAYRPTMRELPDELLGSALVVVDQAEAALEEAGEILHAIDSGALAASDLVELGTLLDDPVPGGLPADRPPRTVFKSVGIGVQDWAVGYAVASALYKT